MIDIYIVGSCDEVTKYVSSAYTVYQDGWRVFEKSWVTKPESKESLNSLGEVLAFIDALKLSVASDYKEVIIHCGSSYIAKLVNRHKISIKKALKMKQEMLRALDDCKGIKITAVQLSRQEKEKDNRFSLCKALARDNLADKTDEIASKGKLVLYTDGAYNPQTGYYGLGVVVYDNDEKAIIDEFYWQDNKFNSAGEIAGDLLAVINAIEWCIDRGITDDVTIAITYVGAFSWATNEWLAKQEVSKEYKSHIDEYSNQVDFSFIHVYRGHRNVLMNKATELAEKACGYAKHPYK